MAGLSVRLPARPVKQARSKRTLERLLDAAEEVLSHDGLEGATVPAIARRACLSVGVVYRRFPDKDALLRTVYERQLQALGRQRPPVPAPTTPMSVGRVPTAETILVIQR